MKERLEPHQVRDIAVHKALHDPLDQKSLSVDIDNVLFPRLLQILYIILKSLASAGVQEPGVIHPAAQLFRVTAVRDPVAENSQWNAFQVLSRKPCAEALEIDVAHSCVTARCHCVGIGGLKPDLSTRKALNEAERKNRKEP